MSELSESQMTDRGVHPVQARRIIFALRRCGYRTTLDVRRAADDDLRKIVNFGPTSLSRVRAVWGQDSDSE